MTSFVVALVLSLASAVCCSGAAILQERSAATGTGSLGAPLYNTDWWASLLLNGAGATLHAVALACGALSIVQPLGASTILFTLLMAAVMNHRRVGTSGWRGAIATAGGLAGLLLLSTSHGHATLSAGPRRILAAVAIVVIATCVPATRLGRRPRVQGVVLAAAGVSFGLASVFTKALLSDWASSDPSPDPLSLAMIVVLSVAGLLLTQSAYRQSGLAGPLATLTVVNPVTATVVGVAAFGESFRHGATGAALACGAGVITVLGLCTLTRVSDSSTRPVAPIVVAASPSDGERLGRAPEMTPLTPVRQPSRRSGSAGLAHRLSHRPRTGVCRVPQQGHVRRRQAAAETSNTALSKTDDHH
jgi:drug/metabolite transporter (DMT)-like permease